MLDDKEVFVEIYFCKFKPQQQIFGRHHVSHFSVCYNLGVKKLGEIEEILPKEILHRLVNEGEVEVFENNIVCSIVPISVGEEGYLRLILKK